MFNDDLGRLESWVASNTDCCKWHGVICNDITGHVSKLRLGNLPSVFGADKISSSLLDLKDLGYLDLSNHSFGLNPIPTFLGSLKSLTFLNLSESTFEEMVPPELGNLSNLRYLNLDSASTYSDSLDWLSGLSMLEFFYLSHVDLGESRLENINKLHSLVELHLSGCSLVEISPLVNFNLSSLLILDLRRNWFKGPIPD
ncbi:receptor like protein 26 [Euphorbia peplus]|nr:receptor like protein 26 [Euphorbia peplus]